jgi:hypothetical protein
MESGGSWKSAEHYIVSRGLFPVEAQIECLPSTSQRPDARALGGVPVPGMAPKKVMGTQNFSRRSWVPQNVILGSAISTPGSAGSSPPPNP